MTHHVHLLVTPCAAGAVGAMVQDIGRRYVRVINTVHGRSGSLWEGRFKSSLIDSETYLLTCHRYYAGTRPDGLIGDYEQFRALGGCEAERREAFCSLFAAPMERQMLEKIRTAINTDSALGSEESCRRPKRGSEDRSALPSEDARQVVTGKLL